VTPWIRIAISCSADTDGYPRSWISRTKPGLTRLSAETATGFRIHGVTPGFVREIHDLGYPSVSAEQLIAMRIHGVTPDYIRAMNRRFNEKLSVSDLVDARIHGVKGDMR